MLEGSVNDDDEVDVDSNNGLLWSPSINCLEVTQLTLDNVQNISPLYFKPSRMYTAGTWYQWLHVCFIFSPSPSP